MDGQGHWWLSVFQGTEAPAQLLETVTIQRELPVPVILLAALPKGNGFDQVVRQATELGVSQMIPVISDRTLLNPSPQKQGRWQRIAQEAAEQSQRQVIPTIATPLGFIEVIQACSGDHRYICVPDTSIHLLDVLPPLSVDSTIAMASGQTLTIATGPEGGWTAEEVEQAVKAGFQIVSLGQRILRAVTAPLVVLSLIAARLEAGAIPDLTDPNHRFR